MQLNLFEPPDTTRRDKRQRLSQAADQIKQTFGTDSLRRASDLDSP